MKTSICIMFSFLMVGAVFAQQMTVEGYVFEEHNRGYIADAKVIALDAETEGVKGEATTDKEGKFSMQLPPIDTGYILVVNHKVFFTKEAYVDMKGKSATDKAFAKIEMERKPGFIFDVTLAENVDKRNRNNIEEVDAITGALIEVYNNTTGEEVLVISDSQSPNFQSVFEQGNHYTVMIRKEGYLAKRMEAFVNVDGCILCFNGVNNITEVMTHGNELGTFLANVEMDKIAINKTFEIENIYYDYDKDYIRPDAAERLDDVVTVLNDNPSITVEMGSHTDSRGRDAYNQDLSERRARSAVQYLIEQGIEASRLTSRGYGEIAIANRCRNGVNCSDEEHEQNRRTELKITGIREVKQDFIPLSRILGDDKLLKEIQENGVIEVKAGEELPEEIKKAIEAQNKGKVESKTEGDKDTEQENEGNE